MGKQKKQSITKPQVKPIPQQQTFKKPSSQKVKQNTRPSGEIDDIFNLAKTVVVPKLEPEHHQATLSDQTAVQVVHFTDQEEQLLKPNNKLCRPPSPTKNRFTSDGFPVFYIEDMIAQQGGGTDECPFDCQCCF